MSGSEGGSDFEEVEQPEVGGMFQVVEKQKISQLHKRDSSIVSHSSLHVTQDWTEPGSVAMIKNLFVTGSWGANDAKVLLAEDDELYGDFEDLEAGDTHAEDKHAQCGSDIENEDSEKKRSNKKKKQKAMFDSNYDNIEGEGTSYLEDLKLEVSEQEKRNKMEFEEMDETTRQIYEGVRPGSYVRMEFKGDALLYKFHVIIF